MPESSVSPPTVGIPADLVASCRSLPLPRLVEALRAQGVHYSELVFPDEVHDFLRHATRLKAYTATAKFLDTRLAP